MSGYISILIYLFFILGFVFISLSINYILDLSKKNPKASLEPFECGAVPIQDNNTTQVPVNYYKLAIMFVLFDLESIFLFLWALAAKPMTSFMFATFLFFMLILVLIFIYVLNEGILTFFEKRKTKVS